MRNYRNRRHKRASPKFQKRRRKMKKLLGRVVRTGKQTDLYLSKLPNHQIFPDRFFCTCEVPLDLYVSLASTVISETYCNFIVKANSVFNPYDAHVKLGGSAFVPQRSNGFDAVPTNCTSMASATPIGISAIWNNNCYSSATVLSSSLSIEVFPLGGWTETNISGSTVGVNNSNTYEVSILPVASPKQSGGTIVQVALDAATNYGSQKMRAQPFVVSSVFRPIGRNRPLVCNLDIADAIGQPRKVFIDDVSKNWNQLPGIDPEETVFYVVSINSIAGVTFSYGDALRMNMKFHVMFSGLTAEDAD